MPIYVFECMTLVQSRLLDRNILLIKSISFWRACVTQSTLCSGTQRQVSVTTEGATRSATLSQVYVTGLACGASDVTGLYHRFGMWCVRCHRFGMWCVRCHRFMSQVWHVVRQMSQVFVTGLACGASDVTGLCHRFGMWCIRCHRFISQVWHVCVRCHRFGMWCVRCHRFMSQVWHVVRQMSQVYVTGLACGASDVTGFCHRFGMWCVRCHRFGMWCVRCHRFMSQVWHVCVRCHRFGMWCVRCHRFMSQVWHVVRQMSQVYVTGLACVRQMSQVWHVCVRCHRFGMCHGVCASDVMSRNVHCIALWKACVKVRHTSEWLV